jgi:hypothetical protein
MTGGLAVHGGDGFHAELDGTPLAITSMRPDWGMRRSVRFMELVMILILAMTALRKVQGIRKGAAFKKPSTRKADEDPGLFPVGILKGFDVDVRGLLAESRRG